MNEAEFQTGIRHLMDELIQDVRSGEEISLTDLSGTIKEGLSESDPALTLDALATMAAACIIELARRPIEPIHL